MDKKTTELLVSHLVAMNSILAKETPRETKEEPIKKVWEVYWLDSVWVLDRDTLRTYANREDAYKYYKELAENTLNEYRKNNERLKRPTCLIDFNEKTYFIDSDYPEFWVDNKKDGNCHMWFEYEECVLQESFIL